MLAYELSVDGSGFSMITLTLLMELDLLCGDDDDVESLECGEESAAAAATTADAVEQGDDGLSTEKPEDGLHVGVDGKLPENDILSMLSDRLSSSDQEKKKTCYRILSLYLKNVSSTHLSLLQGYSVNRVHATVYMDPLFHY